MPGNGWYGWSGCWTGDLFLRWPCIFLFRSTSLWHSFSCAAPLYSIAMPSGIITSIMMRTFTGFPFFILEHAMSIAGMSMSPEQTSATVYTDAYSILQHRNVVEMVLSSCRPMFSDLSMGLGAEAARMLREQGRAGETLFSYLPAPAFMSAGEQLFDDILRDNEITGAAASRLRGNQQTAAGAWWENQLTGGQGEFIQILQLGEMEHRADTCFISTSLSLLGKRKVVVSPAHYARGLRELALRLEAFPATVCFWPQMLTTSVFLP